MRDKVLISLIIAAVLLHLAHSVDHVIRGDFPLVLTTATLVFLATTVALYGFVAIGLWLYWRGTIGPRFWAIAASIAVAFGWLGHFSPFTEQPPRHILNAYTSAAAGWLALFVLIALMLTLIATVLYAGYLWLRPKAQAPAHALDQGAV